MISRACLIAALVAVSAIAATTTANAGPPPPSNKDSRMPAAAGLKLVHFGSEDWARVGLRDGEVRLSARREVCRLGSRGTTVP
jgi:hypothetical protein